MRILVIEDEPDLARHIAAALTRQGHTASVRKDGLEGLNTALDTRPDLIVLDVNLPTLDGFAVLTRLRRQHVDSRVIILTARGDVESRVKGLTSGADDYLAKPFSMDELVARVQVLGRRGGTLKETDILEAGDLIMDVPHRKLTRHAEKIELSPREFEVLQIFMREPGRVFTRDEICERIWQREHQYDTRTVEIFIMRLRKKLEVDGRPALIQTVRGVGYQLIKPE